MQTMVGDGSPLSRAVVYCNSTKAVSIGSLSSAVPTLADTTISVPITDIKFDLEGKYPQYVDNFTKALVIDTKKYPITNARLLFAGYRENLVKWYIPENLTIPLKRQYLFLFLEGVDKQTFLSIFGKGELDLTTLVQISKRNNIKLDSTTNSARSNKDGLATLSMRFISGIQDTYTIICQSGTKFSQKSQGIKLINPIFNVTFVEDIAQKINVDFTKASDGSLKPTYTKLNNTVKFAVWSGPNQPFTGQIYDIQVKVIRKEKVDYVRSLIETDTTGISIDELEILYKFGNDDPGVKNKLNRLWNILTTAAGSIMTSFDAADVVKTKNVTFTHIFQNVYEIRYMELEFNKIGDYQIGVIINGIESPLSGVISVNKFIEGGHYQEVTPLLCTITVYALCVLLVLANLPSMWSYSPLITICVSGYAIYLFAFTKYYASYFCYIMISLIGLIVVQQLTQLIGVIKAKRKYLTHKAMKQQIFYEYTFRRIFNTPTVAWVFS